MFHLYSLKDLNISKYKVMITFNADIQLKDYDHYAIISTDFFFQLSILYNVIH